MEEKTKRRRKAEEVSCPYCDSVSLYGAPQYVIPTGWDNGHITSWLDVPNHHCPNCGRPLKKEAK